MKHKKQLSKLYFSQFGTLLQGSSEFWMIFQFQLTRRFRTSFLIHRKIRDCNEINHALSRHFQTLLRTKITCWIFFFQLYFNLKNFWRNIFLMSPQQLTFQLISSISKLLSKIWREGPFTKALHKAIAKYCDKSRPDPDSGWKKA